MDQVQDMPILDEAKNTVEIVVHFSENLEGRQRYNLVDALEKKAALFLQNSVPLRYHLMLVGYDRDQYSSQDVLSY